MSNKNKLALESLSMDVKRVAIGYHRNSIKMAERFYEEALKRIQEIDCTEVKPYINTILKKIENAKAISRERIAEDMLMYSTILQNYTQTLSK